MASCKKSQKVLHALQKANMLVFYAKKKSIYLNLICEKQIIIKPAWRDMLSSRTPGFCKTFFRNGRCPLWTSLTVLSKLMYNISEKLLNYLQIPGYLLHFISAIIDIIISREVDNRRFNFITKYIEIFPLL